LYYQFFIDQKEVKKELLIEKKHEILINLKEKINLKQDLKLYKKIINKIKESEELHFDLQNDNKKDYYIIDKLYNNLFLKKNENENIIKKFYKILKIKEDDKRQKKIENLSIKNLLKITKDDIKIKKK
jgi:hypothetical protein